MHSANKENCNCNTSGAAFTRKNTLTRHKKRHSGKPTYQCKTCGKSFYRRDKHVEHIQIHDDDEAINDLKHTSLRPLRDNNAVHSTG